MRWSRLCGRPGGGFPGIRAQGTTDARAQGTTDAPGSEEGSEDGDDVDEGEQRAPVATEEPGLLAGVELDSFLHATENGPGKISSFCEVDGKQIHKQRALTEFMGTEFRNASRDRLKRVRAYTAGPSGSSTGSRGVGKRGGEAAGIDNTDSRGIVVGDPFAMLVATPGRSPTQYALGLFSCTKAPSEEQAQDGAVVKGRLMKLQWSSVAPAIAADRLEEGDGTPSSDIGEDGTPATGSWQYWGELGLHKGELSCKCRLVLPLDPDVVVTPVVVKETVTRTVLREGPMVQEQVEIEKSVDRTSFRFELADLTAVKDILVDEVDALSAWRHLPAQKTSGVDANPLPLHEDLFHVQAGALGVAPSGGLGSEKICCKLCTREVQRSKMRLHVGGHILKDKVRVFLIFVGMGMQDRVRLNLF